MLAPIALTCGEPAGIGPEIVVKARQILRNEIPFFWMGDPRHLPQGTAWAEVAHAELPGGRNKPDIDMVAARFRQWAAEKGIPLKGPQILPAFEGFCRKWKIRD